MAKLFLKKSSAAFIIVLVFFTFYTALFIYKTSFVVGDERYFSLFDDAMVSMRYARNLVEGYGLVMNPGERVEGITNPLWTLYMAAVHLLPLPQPKVSLIIQITAALCLLLNLVFVRKISLMISGNREYVALAAVLLTAFYLPLINWSLQGMEVCLLTPLMSIIMWRVLLSLRENRVPTDAYVLLGIGTLIRIDMVVPLIGMWLFLIAFSGSEHRTQNIFRGTLVLVLFLGGQTLFRLLYYGELLPNTYYLKMTGYPVLLRIIRGFIVWWRFIWNMNLLFFLVPVCTIIYAGNRSIGLLGLAAVLQMLYSIYVGGDAWEDWGGSNRYIACIMPLFFIMFTYGISLIKNLFAERVKKKDVPPGKTSFIMKYHFPVLILISFVQFNSNSGSLTMGGMVFLDLPPHVENNRSMVERALIVKQITTPEAHVAVTWAGAIPYYSERYTVDILGKTDRTVARLNMHTTSGLKKFTYFLPGHLKYDYRYSIGKLKPDAVLQFWGDLQEADPYIAGTYVKLVAGDLWVYVREGTKNVRWDLFKTDTK